MTELILQAASRVDQAELYWHRQHTIDVRFENYALQRITQDDLSSVALRVIDRGNLGLSYGVGPKQEGLLEEAVVAAELGGRADFSFSTARAFPSVIAYDEAAAELTSRDLVSLCEAVTAKIQRGRPDIALIVHCQSATEHLTVETTGGVHGEHRATRLTLSFGAPVKGAGLGVYRTEAAISPFDPPREAIEEFLEWYSWTGKTSTPKTGRLPVIIAPEASSLLTLPLRAGLSGQAIAKGTSPLLARAGETILSEKLTITDDPLRPEDPKSRPFDDEGVPCRTLPLVENGVMQNVLLDLHSAAELNKTSTGNGFKRSLFASGTESPPNPWPGHVVIAPGQTPYKEMIADLEEGILLIGGMGFHSGNYTQGLFAVQAHGFHIIGGRVKGRLDRTMVAGSIYQDFLDIGALSNERRESPGGLAPYILVDSLQVAGRS